MSWFSRRTRRLLPAAACFILMRGARTSRSRLQPRQSDRNCRRHWRRSCVFLTTDSTWPPRQRSRACFRRCSRWCSRCQRAGTSRVCGWPTSRWPGSVCPGPRDGRDFALDSTRRFLKEQRWEFVSWPTGTWKTGPWAVRSVGMCPCQMSLWRWPEATGRTSRG